MNTPHAIDSPLARASKAPDQCPLYRALLWRVPLSAQMPEVARGERPFAGFPNWALVRDLAVAGLIDLNTDAFFAYMVEVIYEQLTGGDGCGAQTAPERMLLESHLRRACAQYLRTSMRCPDSAHDDRDANLALMLFFAAAGDEHALIHRYAVDLPDEWPDAALYPEAALRDVLTPRGLEVYLAALPVSHVFQESLAVDPATGVEYIVTARGDRWLPDAPNPRPR